MSYPNTSNRKENRIASAARVLKASCSFCGVTGIKPTYGTVSRYGLIAYGSSLDQIGPVAKDVTDCATILETIASYDKKDSTSAFFRPN